MPWWLHFVVGFGACGGILYWLNGRNQMDLKNLLEKGKGLLVGAQDSSYSRSWIIVAVCCFIAAKYPNLLANEFTQNLIEKLLYITGGAHIAKNVPALFGSKK